MRKDVPEYRSWLVVPWLFSAIAKSMVQGFPKTKDIDRVGYSVKGVCRDPEAYERSELSGAQYFTTTFVEYVTTTASDPIQSNGRFGGAKSLHDDSLFLSIL
jgi:hypothetical protein